MPAQIAGAVYQMTAWQCEAGMLLRQQHRCKRYVTKEHSHDQSALHLLRKNHRVTYNLDAQATCTNV